MNSHNVPILWQKSWPLGIFSFLGTINYGALYSFLKGKLHYMNSDKMHATREDAVILYIE